MIITLNTRSEYTPGTLIVDKNKGVYGIVLSQKDKWDGGAGVTWRSYYIKSLNLSQYSLIRKLQLLIIKKAFQ